MELILNTFGLSLNCDNETFVIIILLKNINERVL